MVTFDGLLYLMGMPLLVASLLLVLINTAIYTHALNASSMYVILKFLPTLAESLFTTRFANISEPRERDDPKDGVCRYNGHT